MKLDTVWRFFRTVGWASVGVVAVTALVIPVLNAMNIGDFDSIKVAAVIGGLTVFGAGLLAVIQSLVTSNSAQASAVQRALYQFGQTALAGLAAPVVANTLLETTVNYGRSLWGTFLVALVAAAQSYVVNAREASPTAVTPIPPS